MGLLDKLFGKKDDVGDKGVVEPVKSAPDREPLTIAEVPPVPVQPVAAAGMPTPLAAPVAPEPAAAEIAAAEPELVTGAGDPARGEDVPAVREAGAAASGQPVSVEQMRQDPNFVRVFDPYGQEVFLTREQWRSEVLPGSLRANWDVPDALYSILINALNDGYFAEVEPAAARLYEIDTNPLRGACIYAIVLLQGGRLDESERVLNAYTAQHGEAGVVLTNLAKVYEARGEAERAEATLWRGLELDPNVDNGLGWLLARELERGGEAAQSAAMERVAALSGSWRVRLLLAKVALGKGDLSRALALYREGLAMFPGPVPTEYLYPMSGDLGLAGHLRELIALTEPLFLPEIHGLMVGNNLIKAHVDLGEVDAASAIVNRLFAMKRPDWRETLGFWDTAIARARIAATPPVQPEELAIGMLEMIGPVWKRAGGPLEAVFGQKSESAPVVTLLGGTADFVPSQEPSAGAMLPDALGRLSRAMPLFLAEQIEFTTAAQARTLLPRVTAGGAGFVLRGGEWTDAEALEFAAEAELSPQFVVKTHVDARVADGGSGESPRWTLLATVLRAADATRVGTVEGVCPAGRPEEAVLGLTAELRRLFEANGITEQTAPAAYTLPEGPALANYLVRLEQLLNVRSAVPDADGRTALFGEREILEGTLFLALQQPGSGAVRGLLAATAVALGRVRSEVVEEFEDRLEMLGRDRPLGEPLDRVYLEMIA